MLCSSKVVSGGEAVKQFYGNSQHSLDGKGRLIIATRHRFDLGENFILVRGLTRDLCLWVMPLDSWDAFCERYLNWIPDNDYEKSAAARDFRANAHLAEQDGQGRVLIPESLRREVGIRAEVMVVGNKDRLEIFDLESWNTRKQTRTFDQVLDLLGSKDSDGPAAAAAPAGQ